MRFQTKVRDDQTGFAAWLPDKAEPKGDGLDDGCPYEDLYAFIKDKETKDTRTTASNAGECATSKRPRVGPRASNIAGGALQGRQGRAAQLRRRENLIARQGIWIAILCMLQGTPRL